tara:strand:- start:59 stop:199 length:141 start_codon:yes stop_codon:yes gene_type:complete
MSLLAQIESYVLQLEVRIQQLQQENQILQQSLQESKGLNPKKDNKK